MIIECKIIILENLECSFLPWQGELQIIDDKVVAVHREDIPICWVQCAEIYTPYDITQFNVIVPWQGECSRFYNRYSICGGGNNWELR